MSRDTVSRGGMRGVAMRLWRPGRRVEPSLYVLLGASGHVVHMSDDRRDPVFSDRLLVSIEVTPREYREWLEMYKARKAKGL